MCGRFFLDATEQDIEALVGPLASADRLAPRYNIAPEQPVAIVREDAVGERRLSLVRWGLVPSWSKGPDPHYSMINARAETVAEKPAYRAALRYRRCLVPASGFYEWRPTGRGKKRPFVVRRADHQPFAMAGIWEHWMGADGNELESCSIIVTDANAAVAAIHEHMPVILDPADFAAWLDRGHQHTADLLPLLRPCPADWLEVYPVSRDVNNPQHEGRALIQRED
jgi:putative SOS response-associated peptidase YedK